MPISSQLTRPKLQHPRWSHWGTLQTGAILVCVLAANAGQAPPTGPETEKRFPPLKVPTGFKANLYACDPFIAYPSVISVGPKANQLFTAVDYIAGQGNKSPRRSEIHLLEDTDGDGYADKSTVYATGFNSIQGLAYHNGTLYVMHAPFLTALRGTDVDGKAGERKDLLSGLGLPPEKNQSLLHCANGVVVGHDGWLYLVLGDNGVQIDRPEGDRLVLEGGGILRCRPDGRDLHLFAMGLRNVYDIALDEELNVLLRDNENDGGIYMIRYAHSIFGADHGYPYLYFERPDEALPPLADLGRGSSAGGSCYLETAFPPEYRNSLYFCEWGRAVMRCKLERSGSTFAPLKELEFAASPKDPYGFKPTDIVVHRDGAMYVSDWADGQQPKRGRGRIYRIIPESGVQATKPPPKNPAVTYWIAQLDSESYSERVDAQDAIERLGREGLKAVTEALAGGKLGVRARLHAVWITAHLSGADALTSLFDLAQKDADPRIRAQAVKAIADLTDPVLAKHRLDAGTGDEQQAKQIAALGKDQDPRVVLEAILALGRLRWSAAPDWLRQSLNNPDPALTHAAVQTLRRSDNWPAVLSLLDGPPLLRSLALRAAARQYHPQLVDSILERLRTEKDAARLSDYADLLTRVSKKPAPWVYWGYSPRARPANSVAWERTEVIEQALNGILVSGDRTVRSAVLKCMQRDKVPVQVETLIQWLRQERELTTVTTLIDLCRGQPAGRVREVLAGVVSDKDYAAANRLTALTVLTSGLEAASEGRLVELAGKVEDGPVLADVLRNLGKRPKLPSSALLLAKLPSTDASVRAAAVEALAELQVAGAGESVRALLADKDIQVRRAATAAVGKLGFRPAIESLLMLAKDTDPLVRRASIDSLRQLKEPRAIPLATAALADAATQLAALQLLGELGGPTHAKAVIDLAQRQPSAEILPTVAGILTTWSANEQLSPARRLELEQAVAEVQGVSGVLVRWQASGPLPAAQATALIESLAAVKAADKPDPPLPRWPTLLATGSEAKVSPPGPGNERDPVWLAYTDVRVAGPATVQFLAASSGTLRVWLNGRAQFERSAIRPFRPDTDRFEGNLIPGVNRLLVQVAAAKAPEFHLRFRQKSSKAEHEQLTQAALERTGDADRGRQLFFNAEKTQCIKCHRLGDQGERIGPELTGIGNRFARVFIIESILEPNRSIAPSYATVLVALKDGKVLTGVKVAESDDELTLGDNQGMKHVIAKSNIEERQPLPQSTMPDGLEKRMTAEEFVDLIAFLTSQK